MAYDSKQLRTFKWLDDIAQCKHSYLKISFPKFPKILAYCDSLYATDEIILVKVDYPEYHNLTDYEWCEIVMYTDEQGYLLPIPALEVRERQFNNNRIFDDFFAKEFEPFELSIDPKVLKVGLKGFEINKINPVVYTCNTMVYLMGHNKDVSIKVAMMGCKSC